MSIQHPVVDKVLDIYGSWIQRRREIRELRELDNGGLAKIAHDLNVTTTDLDSLVHQGPRSSDELPKLLATLGLDSELLPRMQPVVLRDMARVCASCQQKRRCNADLAAGTSDQHYEEYCLNASSIDELVGKADPAPTPRNYDR